MFEIFVFFKIQPLFLCLIISSRPPVLIEIFGTPQDIDSITEYGMFSCLERQKDKSTALYKFLSL